MKTLIKKATVKKIVSLAMSVAMLMSSQAFAIEQVNDSERYIGTQGWVDSFEDSAYTTGGVIGKDVFATNGQALPNGFYLREDPKGQNGRSLAITYGVFDTTTYSKSSYNPTFEPAIGTGIKIADTGAAMLSFDMYLPTNFYTSGSDSTSILISVFPRYTGTTKTSDYLAFNIDSNGLSVPGFNTAKLPIGRWFNIKYILNCDETSASFAKSDLYVDGVEVGKDVVANFKFNGGVGYDNIRDYGIESVRFGLVTTDGKGEISPAYEVFVDNIELRALNDVEVVSYKYKNGAEGTDVLAAGTNSFDVKIRNRGADKIAPVVGIMLYRDGELCGLSLDNATEIAAGADGDVSLSVNIDTLDDGEYELRTFVWDGAETLKSVKTQMTLKE